MRRRTFLHRLLGALGIGISGRIPAHEIGLDPGRPILLQESPLAGYQYHRGPGIWPFLQPGERLILRREPANRHDPYAIAVWFRNDHLGYVPRRENQTLAQMMDRGEQLEARITRLLEDDNPWRRIRFRIDLKPRYS